MLNDNIFTYSVPTKIIYGNNSQYELKDELKDNGLQKVLVVTDKGVRKVGLLAGIEKQLAETGLEYQIYDEMDFEPTVETITKGAEIVREKDYDCVVGVGGGSPLDTAKAIAVLATNDGNVKDYVGVDKYQKDPLPFIALPTTSGTGSEATRWSLIVDRNNEEKIAIGCWQAMPDIAICDPQLTKTMPPKLTASTGMDALTHSIEALVNTNCQYISEGMAAKSITLISNNLRQAVANGKNMQARDAMLMGSLTAALSFNVTGITSVHAISHVVGAHLGIPHGIANAILLPHVMEFSLIGAPERYAQIASLMGEKCEGLTVMEQARKSVNAVNSLLDDIDIPHRFKNCEFAGEKIKDLRDPEKQMERLAREAASSGSNLLNPRQITAEDIRDILNKAF